MKKNTFFIVSLWGCLLGLSVAAIQFLKMYARQIDYPVGPIFDIVLILLFLYFVYMGIKEYRNKKQDGYIRFSKAYGIGVLITVVAFFISFLYYNIHYSYIEKDGLEQLNERSLESYTTKIQRDTISQEDIEYFTNQTDSLLINRKNVLLQTENVDCDTIIEQQLTKIMEAFRFRIEARQNKDTANYKYASFGDHAQNTLMDIFNNMMPNSIMEDSCRVVFSKIIIGTKEDMSTIDPVSRKIESDKSKIPHYTNVMAVSLNYSLLNLLYGCFLSIFVALYLSKRKEVPTEEEIVDEENINDGEMENEKKL